MFYRNLFRRALTVHLTSCSFRFFTTTTAAMSPASSASSAFKLDRGIFNDTLYSNIRDFWFRHLPHDAAAQNDESGQMWFGGGPSLDRECRQNFEHALEAAAPDKLTLPSFESYEKDIENAASLTRPFLDDVKQAQTQSEKHAADTLLSLMLLFDELPRNIYRSGTGLQLVFKHYDPIAFSLLRASMALKPSPVDAECYLLRPVVRQFLLMPIMHSEHLPSHHLYMDIVQEARCQAELKGLEEAVKQCDQNLSYERKHLEPLERFGRYPHRNFAMGRENTPEEEEFLKTAETFGVGQEDDGGKKGAGKSEL